IFAPVARDRGERAGGLGAELAHELAHAVEIALAKCQLGAVRQHPGLGQAERDGPAESLVRLAVLALERQQAGVPRPGAGIPGLALEELTEIAPRLRYAMTQQVALHDSPVDELPVRFRQLLQNRHPGALRRVQRLERGT